MTRILQGALCLLVFAASSVGQQKRLWVLRAPGEMVEYDPATFAIKQTVKIPPEAIKSPGSLSVNRAGQVLFAPAVPLPLSDEDISGQHKIWLWNGHTATTIDEAVEHKTEKVGSNEALLESAPAPFLSADGNHLFWFANQQRRLQREGVDLSITATWQGWQTDNSGGNRQDIATAKLPECRCTSGSCEETCPTSSVWAPTDGIGSFFLVTQSIAGQTGTTYKGSTLYQVSAGKWSATSLPDALHRVLDASSDGGVIVEAIPDTGCCGWSNQSNDQTLVHVSGKTLTLFDEQATYKNPDYDVSFYTSDAKLSPDLTSVAMTITATSEANKPIQISEQGQANPEESKQIRKTLTELPAVEVKSLDDSLRRIAFVPHASLVGWISKSELLMLEDHLLVIYNLDKASRKKSTVKVEDPARIFLR